MATLNLLQITHLNETTCIHWKQLAEQMSAVVYIVTVHLTSVCISYNTSRRDMADL